MLLIPIETIAQGNASGEAMANINMFLILQWDRSTIIVHDVYYLREW
jgi:hypothetical protein